MGTHCEQDQETKALERRSRRLKAAVEQWKNVIDATRTSSIDCDELVPDLVKTLRMSTKKSARTH